jgi:thimet oligopeptidase
MRLRAKIAAALVILVVTTGGAAQTPAPPARPADPWHAWVGLKTSSDLDVWVDWHIAEEKHLVAELLAVKGTRTPDNTLELYDQAQNHLTIAANEIEVQLVVNPLSAIRDRAQQLAQTISAETTALGLNHDVYEAVRGMDLSNSDAATRHYVERILIGFRVGGVDKDSATRETVRRLSDRATEIALKFNRNVQDDVRKVEVTGKTELDGLPADFIERHKPAADGTITLTTDSDSRAVLSWATSPKLRRAMWLAYNQRGYPANKQLLMDLLAVRYKLANMLGFATWADLATADAMMGSAARMSTFLNQMDEVTRTRADREFDQLSSCVARQDPKALPLAVSDFFYWSNQYGCLVRNFDSRSVRPYFPYPAVEAGVLRVASRLFHVEFREIKDTPVWDQSVHVYDVYDSLNGDARAGRIYLDMHPREGKDKWDSSRKMIPGRRGEQLPEAVLVENLPGGIAGDPGLMGIGGVGTFLHEFGHLMNQVIGGRQRWAGQSGTTTEIDFVEAPSLMLEEMAENPAILQSIAKHYRTGETIPLELISKAKHAGFQRAGAWQAQVSAATLSLELHNRRPEDIDLDALYKANFIRFNSASFLEGDRSYAAFIHLMGMSSNYYIYLFDQVIALDFLAQFDQKNILDGPVPLRYRKTVLEPGGSKPAAELVRDFLGRPQKVDAFTKWLDEELDYGPPQ